jgi:GNAT superfamily N-acetyltransferase
MLIQLAESDTQIERCFSVMTQLRPHLSQADFVDRVQQQRQTGYQLVFLEMENQVVAVAGFRISNNLAWGKFLYVDDLIVDKNKRSHGYGKQLFQWLVKYAQDRHCKQLHLDSGVQRFAAHKFYLQQNMNISSHHFSLTI